MTLRPEQKGVVRGIVPAAIFCALFLVVGYLAVPPPEIPTSEGAGARIAFALQADVFVFLCLVAAVGLVASLRFFSPQDIGGSARGDPGERIRVPLAFLQNTLEQCVLAVGAHLALAAVLRSPEMRLIPLLVALFVIGRATFWIGYRGNGLGRAFGFATTFYPTVFAYALAVVLLIVR
jgi:hypothetical protein